MGCRWEFSETEQVQETNEVIGRRLFKKKLGFIATRRHEFKGVQEFEFSLQRIDWMNTRKVVIKEHFADTFITASTQLNGILDQNGRENKNYRISIPGSGGMALVLTAYDVPGVSIYRYWPLPVADGALCIQKSLIAIDFEIMNQVSSLMRKILDGQAGDFVTGGGDPPPPPPAAAPAAAAPTSSASHDEGDDYDDGDD